jgi:hypothetical protein
MMACVTSWFDTHRSLAVSLSQPAWAWRRWRYRRWRLAVSNHDWRTSMQIVALVVARS